METKEKNTATPYDLDGKPPLKLAIPLGLQHVLAMFVGNLTPLLIITGVCGIESGSELQVALLQNAMLIAGIVTLIQIYTIGPVGGKLPIVMGTSSGFIGVCRSVAVTMGSGVAGYGAILAASFIGGLFETVLGGFLKPLRKFFPAVVTGCIVNRSFTDFCWYRFFWWRKYRTRLWFTGEPFGRYGSFGCNYCTETWN